jgi:hypothetical protein
MALLLACGAANAQVVQWSTASGGNGHCYQIVYQTSTWDAARQDAINKGGSLASIGSAAENAFVYSLIAGDPRFWTFERVASNGATYYHGPWLGGSQPTECVPIDPACGWTWASGEPWVYTNWYPGEPNDLVYPNPSAENRLQFFGATGPTPKWNDRPNSRATVPVRAYVVEYEGSGAPPQSIYNVGFGDTCLLTLPASMSWFNGWPWLGFRYPGESYTQTDGTQHDGKLDVAILGSGKPAANDQGLISPRTLYFGDFCVSASGLCISPGLYPAKTVQLGSVQVQDLDWTFDFGSGSDGGWGCATQPTATPGGMKILGTSGACGTPLIIGTETAVTKVPGDATLTLRSTGTLETVGTIIGDSPNSSGELILEAVGPLQSVASTLKTGALWLGRSGTGNLFAYNKSSIICAGASVAINAPANVLLSGATWTDSKVPGGGTIFGAGNAATVTLTSSTMTLDAANPLILAQGAGSSCALVLDSASTLSNGLGAAIIGDSGTASVTVRGGSAFSASATTFARLVGSSANMTVKGATSSLYAAAPIIGGLGTATVTLDNAGLTTFAGGTTFVGQNSVGTINATGSRINCFPAITLGRYSDTLGKGSGTVTLTSGSVLSATQITTGLDGDGQLNVQSGSSVSGTDLVMAVGASSVSGVSIDNATMSFTGTTVVGGTVNVAGGTATIGVNGNGRLTTKRLFAWPGSTITINGGTIGSGGGINVGTSNTIINKTMVVETGSMLNLGGTLNGNLRVDGGNASPGFVLPGTATVNGTLTCLAGAFCDINVGVVGDAVVADAFAVSGDVALNGRLSVVVAPIAKVPYKFSKTVISGPSRTGTFASTTLPPRWRLSYGSAPNLVTISYCAADFDDDGFLTFEDFDAFINALDTGLASADFNRDGFLTFEDFDAFVSAFESGC